MPLTWRNNRNLEDLFQAAFWASRSVAHDMARDAGTLMVRNVKRNTPVEQFLKDRRHPWHLRDRIDVKELRVYYGRESADLYVTGAETEVEYAPYVEEGTGTFGPSSAPYIIRPKRPGGWLSWITQFGFTRDDGTVVAPGTRVFAKEVLHPGSPGAHMFAFGAALTEHEWPWVARGALDEFEREMQVNLRRGVR